METWMVIQGVGVVGGVGALVGAVLAFKNGKKPVGVLALLVAGGLGFLALNATAFAPAPLEPAPDAEPAPLGDDDFDAPL